MHQVHLSYGSRPSVIQNSAMTSPFPVMTSSNMTLPDPYGGHYVGKPETNYATSAESWTDVNGTDEFETDICDVALGSTGSKKRRLEMNKQINVLKSQLPLLSSARERLSQLQTMSHVCVYIAKCKLFSRLPHYVANSNDHIFGLGRSGLAMISSCISDILPGFIIACTKSGQLLYISDNVTDYIGHSTIEMTTQGDNIFDIIDKSHHASVRESLVEGLGRPYGERIQFLCRMKVRNQRRQYICGDQKLIHVQGHYVQLETDSLSSSDRAVFVGLCDVTISPDVHDVRMMNSLMCFETVHDLSMAYVEVDDRCEYHLGFGLETAVGRSWYSMIHPDDLTVAKSKHEAVISARREMGCMVTVRFMTDHGYTIWLNIIMRNDRKPRNGQAGIVCINQVISEEDAQQFRDQSNVYAPSITPSPVPLWPQDAGDIDGVTINYVPNNTCYFVRADGPEQEYAQEVAPDYAGYYAEECGGYVDHAYRGGGEEDYQQVEDYRRRLNARLEIDAN